jgi:hypothetical protein
MQCFEKIKVKNSKYSSYWEKKSLSWTFESQELAACECTKEFHVLSAFS